MTDGTVPAPWQNSVLQDILLRDNPYQGTVPAEFGTMVELRELHLEAMP
jgi:hypothetical protein